MPLSPLNLWAITSPVDAILILGNQLFDTKFFGQIKPENSWVFMREDRELCTHFRYHKHKIIFFLSAMRAYAEDLKSKGFKVHYEKLEDSSKGYDFALTKFLQEQRITNLSYFEIEDKFFEKRIKEVFAHNKNLSTQVIPSPMFLTSRAEFRSYLSSVKKPFMKTFYEGQRKHLKILLDKNNKPMGGRWSFDDENRQKLPLNYVAPSLPEVRLSSLDKQVIKLVEEKFKSHPGNGKDFWMPTDRRQARAWLEDFVENRLEKFGPYEDALSGDFPFVNHSVLTPFLNTGLLTPQEVIDCVLRAHSNQGLALNSVEGFVRQIIGWREFIRGIYQNYSESQETLNFWGHERKLSDCWYSGNTGIPPLDDVIKKTLRYGYAHHIERLMVAGSLMLLLEIEPTEAHKWFMEMFVDSSDWVMGPNVFGMALFSDGGVFATKPYFCGSNYYCKMGPYKKDKWCDGVDGLYWGFIDKNRKFFASNPRLSMMVKTLDKMDKARRQKIYKAAEILKSRLCVSPN